MKPHFLARGVWACLLTLAASNQAMTQPPKGPGAKPGVSLNDAKAYQGYTLVNPMKSTKVYLIDMDGRVVHNWETDCTPAVSAYLLDNGNLLRPGSMGKGGPAAPGAGGRVQEYAWDGSKVWDYTFVRKDFYPHHDILRLPNGNILLVVAHKKTKDEAIAAGRRPESAKDGVTADCIIEVKPTGKTTGDIVWEWHAWDHLVQDADKTKDNYEKVSAHPELIDINYGQSFLDKKGPKDKKDKKDGKDAKDLKDKNKEEIEKLRALGYLGGPNAGGPVNLNADWTHVNGIAYNADLDQIMISIHSFSEFWIIDHSTTTKEAASHAGGKYGKGGDLLYRWGNPQAYRNGTNTDQRLFRQHNAHWIAKGLPGAGRVMVFNNGERRPDGAYSSVDEIVLPLNKDGSYDRKPGQAFGPSKADWSYTAPNKPDFFAKLISGAQRLPNGNTIICSGPDGKVFEVTPEKETVWTFVNPIKDDKGFGPGKGFPGKGFPDKGFPDKGFPDKGPGAGKGPGGGPGPGGLFRANRYGLDHPAFQNRTLTPGKKLEEL
jgi:hypothetical protein